MAASFSDIRGWVNGHSGIATLAALILAGASVGVMANNLLRGPRYEPLPVYFYDLNSGQLFVEQSNLIAPIASPTDTGEEREPNGVRAFVFTCTSCDDEASRFIGWLEKYSPAAKAMLEMPMEEMDADTALRFDTEFERGHLLRGVDDRRWVTAESDRALALMDRAMTRCGEENTPRPCVPE